MACGWCKTKTEDGGLCLECSQCLTMNIDRLGQGSETLMNQLKPMGTSYQPMGKKKHLKIAKAVAKAKVKKQGLYNSSNLKEFIGKQQSKDINKS